MWRPFPGQVATDGKYEIRGHRALTLSRMSLLHRTLLYEGQGLVVRLKSAVSYELAQVVNK